MKRGSAATNSKMIVGATLGYWMAVGSLRSFVAVRLDEIGASAALLGIAIAVSPFAGMILALPYGRIIDRIGARRVALVGAVAMAVLGLLYAWTTTVGNLLILQLLSGASEMAVWVALQALITIDKATGSARSIALFSTAWGLGATVGPLVGAYLLDNFTWIGLSLFYSVASFGAIAVYLVVESSSRMPTTSDGRLPATTVVMSFLREPATRAVLLASFVVQFVVAVRQSYYPIFLQERGLSVVGIGALISLYALVSLLVRPLTPIAMRFRSANRLIVLSVWTSVGGLAVTAFPGYVLLVLGAVMMGAGMGMNTILGVHEMAENTEPETRGMAMAMRMVVNRVAHVSQPLSFAGLVGLLGLSGAFLGGASVLAVAALLTGRDFRRAEAKTLLSARDENNYG